MLPRPLEALAELFDLLAFNATSGLMPDTAWQAVLERPELADDGWLERVHRAGARMSHRDWLLLDASRRRLREEWEDFFTDVDVLVTPVTPVQAHPHDLDRPQQARHYLLDGRLRRHRPDFTAWSGATGVAYLPSTVAPVGLDAEGLPVAVQVTSREFDDRTAIHTAGLISRAMPDIGRPALVSELDPQQFTERRSPLD